MMHSMKNMPLFLNYICAVLFLTFIILNLNDCSECFIQFSFVFIVHYSKAAHVFYRQLMKYNILGRHDIKEKCTYA